MANASQISLDTYRQAWLFLATNYVDKPFTSLNQLLLEALLRLPKTGKITSDEDLLALEAINRLMNFLSLDDLLGSDIEDYYMKVVARREFSANI